jgi:hypothetical protein
MHLQRRTVVVCGACHEGGEVVVMLAEPAQEAEAVKISSFRDIA